MKLLVDTDVVSALRRPDRNPEARTALGRFPADDLFLSAISIGEIEGGIARVRDTAHRRKLEMWLTRMGYEFAGHILPVDFETARIWGRLSGKAADSGRTVPVADGLIAATALRHGLTVATRNERDYAATGAPVFNPWKSSRD